MRQTLNLLAEVLALPFSGLFSKKDLLAKCIGTAMEKTDPRHTFTSELKKALDALLPSASDYINRHTALHNTNHLQDLINYVFSADEITEIRNRCPELKDPVSIANYYYITHITDIAESFLTTRNGKIAFKYWPGGSEAYPLFKRESEENETVQKHKRPLLDSSLESRRIEAWHALTRCIPESLLISGYVLMLSKDFDEGTRGASSVNILHQMGSTVNISDIMLDKVLAQGLAETHLHTGASRSFDLIWEEAVRYALSGQARKDDSADAKPHLITREALIVRSLLAVYLRSECKSFQKFILTENGGAIEAVHSHAFSVIMDKITEKGERPDWFASAVYRLPAFITHLTGCRGENTLSHILDIPQNLQKNDPGLAERCFMTLAMMHIVDLPSDVYFTAVFIYYLRLKSRFYRYCTQDSKSSGLKYFQQYYRQSTRAGTAGERKEKERQLSNYILNAIRDERIIKTEFRMSLPISEKAYPEAAERKLLLELKNQVLLFIRQHIYSVSVLYGNPDSNFQGFFSSQWPAVCAGILRGEADVLKHFLERFGVNVGHIHRHRLGIIYHFIKSGEKNEDSSCFIKSIEKPAPFKYKAFSFGTTRFECCAIVRTIAKIRKLCPELSRLIVGLDAASLELPTEPWVYAPAFRMARDIDLYPICDATFLEINYRKMTLGLTYHVGEEFRHPLSGLRHIGEASEFYKLHTGDRLGHALALGIDVDQWFSSHGLVAIPTVEWMENCLWVWELIAKELTSQNSIQYTAFLEKQIMSCAEKIFGTLNGISIEKLCSAYRSKTLPCEDMITIAKKWCASQKIGIEYSRDFDCSKCSDSTDSKFFPCIPERNPKEPWWSEASLSMSYHCSFYKSKMDRELLREPSEQEIQISQEVQSYLRKRISEKGIIIEENPSSNTAVGEIDGILSHPICNLRNAADSPAIISTISTDDPSVFNASLANEYALIYYALIHDLHSVEKALNTVDTIRKAGLDGSFIGSVPPFNELLREYEQIILAISSLNI